jgi:hypothetical protein
VKGSAEDLGKDVIESFLDKAGKLTECKIGGKLVGGACAGSKI